MKVSLFTFVGGCLLIAVSCNTDGGGMAGPKPVGPSKSTIDTFVVSGQLSGVVVGTGSTAKDARLFTYGYFEGDSIARAVGPTSSARADGRYLVQLFDLLVVAADTQAGTRARRWRALVVAFPLIGPGAGVTLAASEWITRAAGDSAPIALQLDISLLPRGVLPNVLPVAIPSDLPARSGAANTSAVTDSARQLGAEVFVRVTGSPSPAALVSLASAGLRFPNGHGAFPYFQSVGGYTVWGHLPPSVESDSALERLVRLPFLTEIDLLATRVEDAPIQSLPTLDSHSLSLTDERRFVYDHASRCFVGNSTTDQTAPVTCDVLIVGLQPGVRSADLGNVLASLGARITRETFDVVGNLGSIVIDLPSTTERRALSALQQNQLVRYVALDYIGGLLTP